MLELALMLDKNLYEGMLITHAHVNYYSASMCRAPDVTVVPLSSHSLLADLVQVIISLLVSSISCATILVHTSGW